MNQGKKLRINQKALRDWILLVCGIVWVSYFAFVNPSAMNPYFMTLGAGALFGPGVVNLWRSDSHSNRNSDDGKIT